MTAGASGCCGAKASLRVEDAITCQSLRGGAKSALPEKAVLASLGCGNPTALAELKAGETVLDLGSGGGIDVLLSARRVGPTGKAYGLDMTDEMLALARDNQRKAGAENVEFLKGEIEAIPLPDNSVDVIISNCVINLSADKDRVLQRSVSGAEARRTVRRFRHRHARRHPEQVRRDMLLWAGCIAGALDEERLSRQACGGRIRSDRRRSRPASIAARTRSAFLADKGFDADASRRCRRQVHERVHPRPEAVTDTPLSARRSTGRRALGPRGVARTATGARS